MTPSPYFRLFSLFCLICLTAFPLTAQNITWLQNGENGSRHGALILLENGNTLHATQDGTERLLTERAPEGETVLERSRLILPAEAITLMRMVRPDTLLTLSQNGDIRIMTESLIVTTLVGSLVIDAEECPDANLLLRNKSWDGDTIVGQLSGNGCDNVYEVRAHYTGGTIVMSSTLMPRQEGRIAYSPSGTKATILLDDNGTDLRLEVSSPTGALLYEQRFDASLWSFNNLQFARNDDLYLFGTFDDLNDTYPARVLRIDLENGTGDTLNFPSPDYEPLTVMGNLTYLNDQLLLSGGTGGFEFHAYLYSLDWQGNLAWRFPAEGDCCFNSFNNIIETADGTYVAGNSGITDFGVSGQSYLLRLDNIPVSTRSVATEQLGLYPNPVKDILTITGLPPTVRSVEIIEATGRRSIAPVVNGQLNVVGLASGMYFLRADSRGRQYVGKFIRR